MVKSATHDLAIWREALFGIEILLLHANPIYYGFGPNLLIRNRLPDTIEKARKETAGKIHLLGHSLGGLLARAVAAQRPGRLPADCRPPGRSPV